LLKCAWCNGKNLVREGDRVISNEVRKCPDCDGRNAFISVPYDNDPDGLVTQMIPTSWAPTGQGLPGHLQPQKWKSDAEGQRELNNLIAGRRTR
jgi:hypothetical protein